MPRMLLRQRPRALLPNASPMLRLQGVRVNSASAQAAANPIPPYALPAASSTRRARSVTHGFDRLFPAGPQS